jgi:hypothetical protein
VGLERSGNTQIAQELLVSRLLGFCDAPRDLSVIGPLVQILQAERNGTYSIQYHRQATGQFQALGIYAVSGNICRSGHYARQIPARMILSRQQHRNMKYFPIMSYEAVLHRIKSRRLLVGGAASTAPRRFQQEIAADFEGNQSLRPPKPALSSIQLN